MEDLRLIYTAGCVSIYHGISIEKWQTYIHVVL